MPLAQMMVTPALSIGRRDQATPLQGFYSAAPSAELRSKALLSLCSCARRQSECSSRPWLTLILGRIISMDFKHLTSPCGLDCWNCPMYLAGQNAQIRKEISEKRNIPLEKAVCRGCRSQGGTISAFDMNEPCMVYKCIETRSIDFCFDCVEFPCDNLHPYADKAVEVAHNTKIFNLCLIRKMGLESWAKTKAKSVSDTYFNRKLAL